MTSALHAEGREFDSHWKYLLNICPRGPTDKASDYESGDCGFESHRGCFCLKNIQIDFLSSLTSSSVGINYCYFKLSLLRVEVQYKMD